MAAEVSVWWVIVIARSEATKQSSPLVQGYWIASSQELLAMTTSTTMLYRRGRACAPLRMRFPVDTNFPCARDCRGAVPVQRLNAWVNALTSR